MNKFGIYEEKVREYCKENNLDFSKTENLDVSWGIDSMSLKNANGDMVIMVAGFDVNDLEITATDIADQELKKAV